MISKRINLLFLIVGVVLGVSVISYLCVNLVFIEKKKNPTPLSSSPPPPPEEVFVFREDFEGLPEGKIIEGPGINIYPKPLKLAVSPFEVQAGSSQILLVAAEDEEGIQKVVAIVEDEVQKEREVRLSLIKGDKKIGLWRGEWRVEKVENDKIYRITFIIQNQKGIEHRVAVGWRGIKK